MPDSVSKGGFSVVHSSHPKVCCCAVTLREFGNVLGEFVERESERVPDQGRKEDEQAAERDRTAEKEVGPKI